MQQQGDKLVCGNCGGWYIPGAVPLTSPVPGTPRNGEPRETR
jgi:hypothetical protein